MQIFASVHSGGVVSTTEAKPADPSGVHEHGVHKHGAGDGMGTGTGTGCQRNADRRWLSIALALIMAFWWPRSWSGCWRTRWRCCPTRPHAHRRRLDPCSRLIALRLSARRARGIFTYGLRRTENPVRAGHGLTLLLLSSG